MDTEIQLISDDDGLAVIGDSVTVERFLASAGLPSRDLGLERLGGSALGRASGIAQAGSEVAANSGRWVKLTEESARVFKHSELMRGSTPGVSRAVATENGKITGLLEIVTTPGSALANPAVLTGVAGIMSQMAMQQSMAEITDYLARASREADSKVPEWLVVLARCVQLQDAISVLELDRVLDASPDELDRHRLGLKAARQKRLELISRSTGQLLARLDAAARLANTKVLLHPKPSHAVVDSCNHAADSVVEFHGLLGIECDRQSLEGKRWVDAVVEVKDKAVKTGADGVDAARELGDEGLDRVLEVGSRTGSNFAGRLEKVRAERDARAEPKSLTDRDGSEKDDRFVGIGERAFHWRRGDKRGED